MQYKRPLCASTVKQAAIKTKQNTTTAATFSGKNNSFFYSLKICTKKILSPPVILKYRVAFILSH